MLLGTGSRTGSCVTGQAGPSGGGQPGRVPWPLSRPPLAFTSLALWETPLPVCMLVMAGCADDSVLFLFLCPLVFVSVLAILY